MDRRERRRLNAEIELLRDNILLAADRGDLKSVRPFEQTLRYLQLLKAADEQCGPRIYRSPPKAVRDVLELIRGPVEMRITPIRKRKKPAKPWTPPERRRGPSGAGAPTSPRLRRK